MLHTLCTSSPLTTLSTAHVTDIDILIWWQQDSTFLNAFTADSGSVGFMSTAWNLLQESRSLWHVELFNEFCQLPSVKRKEKRTGHWSLKMPQRGSFYWKSIHVLQGLVVTCMTGMMRTNREWNDLSQFLHEVSGGAWCKWIWKCQKHARCELS